MAKAKPPILEIGVGYGILAAGLGQLSDGHGWAKEPSDMREPLIKALKGAKRRFYDKSGTGRTAADVMKTVEKWDYSDLAYSREGFKCYWELLEEVQRYQSDMMADGRDVIQYLTSFFPEGKYLKDLNGLVIGCTYGEHAPANSLAKTGAFHRLSVVDISDGLLKRQKELTRKLGLERVIKYKRMDLNMESIKEADRYDLILGVGTIHHIERLEGLFSEINNALGEDGIFCMREYVGPSRLQFTDKQINLCNRVLQGLPDDLKKGQDGRIKDEVLRPPVEEVIADDPSEAVRSEDIMGVGGRYLQALACNWTGGTLLHPLLDGIAGNFEGGDSERAVLKGLIVLERVLIEEGVIPSDYVFFVGKSI